MKTKNAEHILTVLLASLEIPESSYETAKNRYEDLGKWLNRLESLCSTNRPRIYPQGSFRLGTVNRPLNDDGEYDLDMGCRLEVGISKFSHSQKNLKEIVGLELEQYRISRNIKNRMEEKHRCWRLQYADKLSFHLDVVPSIPESQQRKVLLREAMMNHRIDASLAQSIAELAGAITDNSRDNYEIISSDWNISNSEGYAIWFESRMKLAQVLLENRTKEAKVGKIEDLPAFRWNSPLQTAVRLLKRHRDVMFEDDHDGQPISIIITTLAAKAYQGENNIVDALQSILWGMEAHIFPNTPRVPNPVNPNEDFADKWTDPVHRHLKLEQKFGLWIKQAQRDFELLLESKDPVFIVAQANKSFATTLNESELKKYLSSSSIQVISSRKTTIVTSAPAKPWRK